jgi:hypothetical protein
MKLNENLDVKIDPYRVVDKIMRDVHNENR